MTRRLTIFALLLLPAVGHAVAQPAVVIRPVPESHLFVDGTSNHSDWTVEAQEISGRFAVEASDDGLILSSGEVHVPSMSLKSERGVIMDRLMRGALKVSQFKDISFVMSGPATGVASDSGYVVTAPGTLTIAGTGHDIELQVHAAPGNEGTWRFRGSHGVSMSDYGMRPPTAMFGALVTGNDVVVRFDVVASVEEVESGG